MSNAPNFMLQRLIESEAVGVRPRTGAAGHLTVACILDEFSAACFGPEADFAPLTMRDWRVELIAAKPDLLLVESAWRGHRNKWTNEVSRRGPELMGILEWCRERGVPTAFWNKEDPVHFRSFLTVAREFDAVFTTDLDSVPSYRAALNHDNVHFLPFAAQPVTHNPIEKFERIDGCAFAGAYYRKYPERTADLERLSEALAEAGPFHIYDRNFGKPDGDYTFPEDYQQFIVGGLTPDEIDIAYKGYTTNLNLNSVKQSQSMFARRVYELMASGTQVVSNFSRGLRTVFGELSITSDSPQEFSRSIARLKAEPNGPERLRVMALRKVMREHTYSERLAFIASAVGINLHNQMPDSPLIVAHCHGAREVELCLRSLHRQEHANWHAAIISDAGVTVDDPRVMVTTTLEDAMAWGRNLSPSHVGQFDPRSWYGPHYLHDILSTLRWAAVDAAGLREHYAWTESGLMRRQPETAWRRASSLDITRSLRRLSTWDEAAELVTLDAGPVDGLAIHPLGYVFRGADSDPAPEVCDLDWSVGSSLAELRDFSRSLQRPPSFTSPYDVDLEKLVAGVAQDPRVTIEHHADGHVSITSDLPADKHTYLYSSGQDVSGFTDPSHPVAHFEVGPGLDVTLAVVFLDEAGKRLGHVMVGNGKNVDLAVPEGCQQLRLGFRVRGPGSAILARVTGQAIPRPPHPVVVPSRKLVVTNIYPSYENLYRNGFVHSRVRAYRDHNVRAEVLCVDEKAIAPSFREFEGVDVTHAGPGTLEGTLAGGGVDHALVHFLSPAMWAALKDNSALQTVNVWVHGSEVQPWWRRAYNYSAEDELRQAKQESDLRLAFWREVLEHLPSNFHFIFVSQYFADEVFEDVGITLPTDRYSIIHNPIDEDVFSYIAKPPEQRKRVLSVRPYASRKYANDLSVAAVLELKDRPGFDDLEFAFHGDGPMWDETLAPLTKFDNVQLHRGFLTHAEIAALHKQYGLFLTPTRMDAQGVSRDEAMSSGLVPLTSSVAAIPEFVDDQVGILADGEDHLALAEGIWALAHDPDRFSKMSAAAAARTRRQCSTEVIIPQELALFD